MANTPEEIEARKATAIARVEARIAAAVESAPPLPDDVAARLRESILAVRRANPQLEERIRRIVDAAPPLTEAQRARLAALLRPSPEGGGGGRSA